MGSLKNPIFSGSCWGKGRFRKNQYIGELSKKGAWTVCRFKRGGLAKKEVVFEGGVDTPNAPYGGTP